jgi:CheY-like chemotaxis protein
MANLLETLRVLVLSHGPSSVWLHDVLGFRPRMRQYVAEDWQVLDALADGCFDLVVVDLRGLAMHPMQLVAMVRTAGRTTPFVLVSDDADEHLRRHVPRHDAVALIERRVAVTPAAVATPVRACS